MTTPPEPARSLRGEIGAEAARKAVQEFLPLRICRRGVRWRTASQTGES
jgi:hypothetical protein